MYERSKLQHFFWEKTPKKSRGTIYGHLTNNWRFLLDSFYIRQTVEEKLAVNTVEKATRIQYILSFLRNIVLLPFLSNQDVPFPAFCLLLVCLTNQCSRLNMKDCSWAPGSQRSRRCVNALPPNFNALYFWWVSGIFVVCNQLSVQVRRPLAQWSKDATLSIGIQRN